MAGAGSGSETSQFITQLFPGLFGPSAPQQPVGPGTTGIFGLNDQKAFQEDQAAFDAFQEGTGPHAAGAEIGQQLLDVFGSRPPQQAFSSPFQDELRGSLLNPSFGADTASEEALLSQIESRTAGVAGVRGLELTKGALAQNLAPALIGLRQDRIGNLSSALTQDIGLQGQNIQQRGQDFSGRQQDIMGLLGLAGLAMPQIVGGNQSSGSSKNFGLSGPPQ